MCGICGSVNGKVQDVEAVRAMSAALIHRGPDAGGLSVLGPAVLGHRRLSIVDLSAEANQPMADAGGRYTIVFNGEIYNHLAIRAELEASGIRFRTHGDTETLLQAYIAWGEGALQRLNGMFAFAVWDGLDQSLFLARDRLGEKPLYYAWLPDGIAFASELEPLRLHPEINDAVNPRAVSQFLSLNYVLGADSMLSGIERLPPAHYLRVQGRRRSAPRPYWDLASHFRDKRRFRSKDEAAEALDALIKDAVALRLMSDVPLGAFLSGGIDSATVVSAMARLRPPSQNLTFSIGFGEKSYDELPEARAVARHLSVTHQDQVVSGDLGAELEEVLQWADGPFADTSFIPTWFLSRFAARQVKVCLTGDGGDELFAGYETYAADRMHRVASRLPRAVRALLAAAAGAAAAPTRFDKVGLDYKAKMFFPGLDLEIDRAHYHWRTIFSPAEKAALLRPERADVLETDPGEAFLAHAREVGGCHYLDRAMYMDIKTWLPDDILHKVDRATMAHSLEGRAPFLDHRLVEFAAALPVDLKLRGLRKKYLLRRSQAHALPASTIQQRKRGFNAPVAHWLNGPWREHALAATTTGPLLEWVQAPAVHALWREHAAGRADNGYKLFGLTCLGLWLQRRPRRAPSAASVFT